MPIKDVTLKLSMNEAAALYGAVNAQLNEARRLRDKYRSVGASFARPHEHMYTLEVQRLERVAIKLSAVL